MPPSQVRTHQTSSGHQPTQAKSFDGVSRWRAPLAVVTLLSLTLIAYAPVYSAGFIWDDDDHVTNNQTLRSATGLMRIWFVPSSLPQYYPLVHTTFWAEYHLWGLTPLGYHLTNVLLHAMNSILLWRLLTRIGLRGAFLAAAIFAVHPAMVESVAWVTERKNVLSLAYALGSLLCYLRFAPLSETPSGNVPIRDVTKFAWYWYAAALLLFVAALLSKTVVATLPAVILVIEWWKRGRIRLRDLVPLAPFFALGISLGFYTAWLERHHVGAIGDEWSLSAIDRVLLAGRVIWFYATTLAWPYPLAFFYPRFTIDSHQAWQFLFPCAAVVVVAVLWRARVALGRGPLAAVLIFGGVLLPALGFVNVYPFRYSFVADHFQYHASIALIALAASAFLLVIDRFAESARRIGYAAAGILVVALASLTFRQSFIYHDLDTLYRDTIAKNPGGWLAYMNLSTHLESLGQYDEAILLEREAVRLNPAEPAVHSNLGATLLKTGQDRGSAPGQLEEVVSELTTALELGRSRSGLAPIVAAIHNNLATALLNLGRRDGFQPGQIDEAIAHLHEALRTNPDFVSAHDNLASALILVGRLPEAIEHLTRSLQLEPNNPDALTGLGTALAAGGHMAEARHSFERALELEPDHAAANYGMALVLLGDKKFDQALDLLARALRKDPGLAEAHYATAGVLAGREQWQQAADHYAAAVRIRPAYDRAWNNLGVMMMKLEKTDQAIDAFQQAVRVNPAYTEAQVNLKRALEVQEQGNPASQTPKGSP